jgi:histidinol-phosphate aminotransferase
MLELDRRQWLTAVGLAIGGLGASRFVAAEPSPVSGPVRLSLNENPFGPAPGVIDALRREFANLCRYTGSEYDALIALIAAREKVPKEQVILGEILEPLGTHLSQAGGPGGEFIYSDPGYTALIDTAVAVGGRAVGVPLNAKLENDLPGIAAKVNEKTRAVFLVNPHNPTGIVADAQELKSFACRISRQSLLIVDEAYLEFADDFAGRTLADLVRNRDNVIVFRTFAVFGLGGLDIGYGLVPARIAKVLIAQGLDNPHLFNRPAVAAASASLQDPNYVAVVTHKVAEERELWFALFRDLKLKFTPSRGNFVFFETGVPHAEFAAALLQQGIVIGRIFHPYDRWARISIGLPPENALARDAVRKVLSKI